MALVPSPPLALVWEWLQIPGRTGCRDGKGAPSWRVVALEVGLGLETNSQLHCLFHSLAGRALRATSLFPSSGKTSATQPPFSLWGRQHDKAKMEPALEPGRPGHLLAVWQWAKPFNCATVSLPS